MNPDFWRRPPQSRWQRARTVARNLLVLAIFASPVVVNIGFPELSDVFNTTLFWLYLGLGGWTLVYFVYVSVKWFKRRLARRHALMEWEQKQKEQSETRETARAARQLARANQKAQYAAALPEIADWAGLGDDDLARLATRFCLPSALPLDIATAASLSRTLDRWRAQGKTPEWVRAEVGSASSSESAPGDVPDEVAFQVATKAVAPAPEIDLERLLAPPMDEGWFEQSWWNEISAYGYRSWDDEQTAQCAMLPEGMEHMERRREKDRRFRQKYDQWREFVSDYRLELLIEQSTDEAGRLLPHELRMMRTYTAPPEWRNAMRELLLAAPKHVLAYVVLWVSMEVRIERAKRTGSAHWRPHEADPPEPERAFRASKFKPRPYGR